MNVGDWPAARVAELPRLLGMRGVLCGFSPVRPLLPLAGVPAGAAADLRQICAAASLSANPAEIDTENGTLVRDLSRIGQDVLDGAGALGPQVQAWVLSPDGGMGGDDPRGFWRAAIRWAGRTPPPLKTNAAQTAMISFCRQCYAAMTDPDWSAAVDTALQAAYDETDIAISARHACGLLDGAAAGGDVNQIGMILGPMRDWSILRGAWAEASPETRAAVQALAPVYWQDRVETGWAGGSRIDTAWLSAPAHQAEKVFGHA